MSAEHAKAKEPLPVRPPRPRPHPQAASSADSLRTAEALVRAVGLLAETYPQPGGRPIHLTASVDGIEFAVDADEETVSFLACRAVESAARGQALTAGPHLRLVTP